MHLDQLSYLNISNCPKVCNIALEILRPSERVTPSAGDIISTAIFWVLWDF